MLENINRSIEDKTLIEYFKRLGFFMISRPEDIIEEHKLFFIFPSYVCKKLEKSSLGFVPRLILLPSTPYRSKLVFLDSKYFLSVLYEETEIGHYFGLPNGNNGVNEQNPFKFLHRKPLKREAYLLQVPYAFQPFSERSYNLADNLELLIQE